MEAARPATDDDLPRLAELCRAAVAEVAAQVRGGALFAARETRPEPVEDSLRRDLADPEACVLVGTVDGEPVGVATVRLERLRDGSSLARIEELYVDAGARGVGVGEAMMAALMAWCQERRCRGIDAQALPGDRATKNFFEGSGFSARLLVMHHRMGDDGQA